MYLKHRNSQKRIYIPYATYFVTTKTYNNFPYFEEKIFCELFIKELKICRQLKQFRLYGWALLYDHFHLMVQPNDRWSYSAIMKSLKENVSCSINRIIKPEGATPASRLQVIYKNKFNISDYQKQFQQKYKNNHPFHEFRWQKSFHDHYIRNENDFMEHLEYIAYNPDKHNMPNNWPYIYTNPKYENLTDNFI